MIWNKLSLKLHYDIVKRSAIRHGFNEDELSNLYLDGLSHQTKSKRIMRMITLAYYLGKLKGIEESDASFNTVQCQ